MELLERIVNLSHEFGTTTYVKGGGGNTSVKNEETLWIKPSGTTLATLAAEDFVPMCRKTLSSVRSRELPTEAKAREAEVSSILMGAVMPGATGRPSVETMLHNAFTEQFVVHTHPSLVNGMTCSVNAESAVKELFPQSVWIEYTDPGYVLFLRVDDEIQKYRAANGKDPNIVFLQNHGVFIAGNDEEEICSLYDSVMDTLKQYYDNKGVTAAVPVAAEPSSLNETASTIAQLLECSVAASGDFAVAEGPLTPDHIVYAKSFPFTGEVSANALETFKNSHGYNPVILRTAGGIFAAAASEKRAALALELALDGAEICKLTTAFGGVNFMTDAAREFIENWEAESYRSSVMK